MPTSDTKSSRILFLDHLRAIACLMVVFGHVFLMGINDFPTISVWVPYVTEPVFGPSSPAKNPFGPLTTWLVLQLNVSFGPLGVGIFFLISGYVILRALDRETPLNFLIRRCFRIFPPALAACAAIALLTRFLVGLHGGTSPHSVFSVFAGGFAVPGFVGAFSSIPVIWSLTVEIVFYLVLGTSAAFIGVLRRGHILALSAASGAAAIAILSGMISPLLPPGLVSAVNTFGFCCFHAGFLLIGSMLYRTADAPMSERVAWGAAACATFAVTVTVITQIGQLGPTGTTAQNCIAAFLIFVIAATLKLRSRWLRPLEFVGRISYSLYLIHIPLAWMLMFELAARGVRATGGAFVATAICLLLAWAMFEVVEKPAQTLGKALTKKARGPGLGVDLGRHEPSGRLKRRGSARG